MAWVKGGLVINRPVEEVFDFVADERNEPRYNPRMLRAEKLTPGPIGVGTRFRAEMAAMRGSAPMTIEFTAYERPRRLASTTRLSNMDIEGITEFRPRLGRNADALVMEDRTAWLPKAVRTARRLPGTRSGADDLDGPEATIERGVSC